MQVGTLFPALRHRWACKVLHASEYTASRMKSILGTCSFICQGLQLGQSEVTISVFVTRYYLSNHSKVDTFCCLVQGRNKQTSGLFSTPSLYC